MRWLAADRNGPLTGTAVVLDDQKGFRWVLAGFWTTVWDLWTQSASGRRVSVTGIDFLTVAVGVIAASQGPIRSGITHWGIIIVEKILSTPT
jgi:hypothetical protein